MENTTTNRTAAIEHLIEKWNADIAAEEVYTEDTIAAMLGQIQKNFQGWDISAEELDEEAQAAMGWGDEDIDWDVWESVVSEAARKWLIAHAADVVAKIATENEGWLRRDIDAMQNGFDFETAMGGYLADGIASEMGGFDEDEDEVFANALVEFFESKF